MTHGNVETPPVPTSGFNVTQSELVKISKSQVPEKVSLNLWEVGGNEKFRKYWSNFYSNTDCLLFLIDPTDVDQIGDAAEELARAAGDYRLGAVPLVVVATKQDLPSSRMDLNVLRRTLIEIGISPQILCRMTAVATPVSQDADGQEPNKGVQELKDLLSRLLEITH